MGITPFFAHGGHRTPERRDEGRLRLRWRPPGTAVSTTSRRLAQRLHRADSRHGHPARAVPPAGTRTPSSRKRSRRGRRDARAPGAAATLLGPPEPTRGFGSSATTPCGCATTSASAPTPRGGRLLGYADHSDLEVFVRLGMTAGGGHRARHVTGRAGVRADREREHRGGAKPLTSWRSTASCTRGRSPQGGLRQHRPITSDTGNSSYVFLLGSSPLDCRPGSPSTREPRSSGSSRPTAPSSSPAAPDPSRGRAD